MAVKLVIGVMAIVGIVSVATVATFWYLNEQSKRRHEKELEQMKHTEKMVEVAESDVSVDPQLDEEENG